MTGGSVQHFFTSGNTARGFASLFDSSLQDLRKLFMLKGGPGAGKSAIIRAVADKMAQSSHDLWLIHCALDHDLLDGVIIPGLKTGIVNGAPPRVISPGLSGEAIRYINLEEGRDASRLAEYQAAIDSLNARMDLSYERAYAGFAEALRIHDDWEALYIARMNFQAADQLTRDFIGLLYGNGKLEKSGRVDHRFLGAATARGAIDFVPNLTDGLKRYLIKGRPGSGKSTMLKKLAAAGSEHGFDVEVYHCGFDPNSFDMIIVRELGFAIFDSTAPHEYFPDRASDEIVDMYELCIKPGTDEEIGMAVSRISGQYSAKMKESIGHLAEAKVCADELKQFGSECMDSRLIERIGQEVVQEIAAME